MKVALYTFLLVIVTLCVCFTGIKLYEYFQGWRHERELRKALEAINKQ